MNCKNAILLLIVTSMALWCAAPSVAQKAFTEDFTSTTYRHDFYTTADWNTADAELKLAAFAPSLTGSVVVPGTSYGVTVDGNHAYVPSGSSGLQVVDITDPANPFSVGGLPMSGISRRVAVVGDLAFVASGTAGLRIVDITIPASPILVGSNSTGSSYRSVDVVGNYAYVAAHSGGVLVFDITNPNLPALVGSFTGLNAAVEVEIAGDLLFVADQSLGMVIMDITNPMMPAYVGGLSTPGFPSDLKISGTHAFLADAHMGLQIIDISNPGMPVIVGNYPTSGSMEQVNVLGNIAYVADSSEGLLTIDISDVTAPALATSFMAPGTVYGLAVSGNQAFLADPAGGLHAVTVAQTNPVAIIGQYDTGGQALDVAADAHYAYVANSWDGLMIFDTTDPANPVLVGQHISGWPIDEVTVEGDIAYVCGFYAPFQTIDISDRTNPTPLGTYSPGGTNADIAVAGDYAFGAAGIIGFLVLDISDPANPTPAGVYDTVGTPYSVALAGDIALLTNSNTLMIFDISDPTNPTPIKTVTMPDTSYETATEGNYAYVAARSGGLQVVDISDPANASVVANFPTAGNATQVAVSGNRLYVGATDGGLQVLDISDPTNPVLIETVGTLSHPAGIAIAGERGYIADNVAGLKILQVAQHEVDATDNMGRSLVFDEESEQIYAARLTSNQTTGVAWELSVDGGSTFETFAAGSWASFANPGADLAWRSTLNWGEPGGPVISDLTVEWLNEYATITSITDIDNDQGKQVSLEWQRSGHDFAGDPSQIVEYAVYRKIDAVQKTAAPVSDLNGQSFAVQQHAAAQKDAGWHFITTVPVRLEDSYAVVAPTLADSTIAGGDHLTTFMVSALTATPGVFFDSAADSGRSIDNLAPGAPQGVMAAYAADEVVLHWDDAAEVDLQYYRVYRGTDSGFVASPENLVAQVGGSGWTDSSVAPWDYHYKVSAVDFAGNESATNEMSLASDVPGAGAGQHFALHNASPNPFNPATTISFTLPTRTDVQLSVYDLSGRLVKSLIGETRDAGDHQIVWDGRDAHGGRVSSGVYLYRIEAGGFGETKRMSLVK